MPHSEPLLDTRKCTPWWCVATQTIGVAVAIAQLWVEGAFLALEAVARQYMVSDGLEHSAVYRVALTASVLAGQACCGVYLGAYLRVGQGWYGAVTGLALLLGAAATWCVLAFVSYDTNAAVHVAGTCAFLVCSTGYVLALLSLHRGTDATRKTFRDTHGWGAAPHRPHAVYDHAVYDHAWYALVAAAAVTCAVYLGIYFTDARNAWVPEQLCLLLFTAAQLAFFYNHLPVH